MIHFSERLIIQQQYEKWLKEQEYSLKDCAMNAVAFLMQNGMLIEDAVHEFCKDKKVM